MRIWESAGHWYVATDTQEFQFADYVSAYEEYRRLQVMSAIKDFQSSVDSMGVLAEQLIPGVDKALDIYAVNQLEAEISGTEAGALVGDSTLTKEAATVYVELMNAFSAFLTKPLGSGLTPKQIVRLRG